MTPELFFDILHTVRAMAADVGCVPELVHHKRGDALVARTCWGQADFTTRTLWVDLKDWQREGPALR